MLMIVTLSWIGVALPVVTWWLGRNLGSAQMRLLAIPLLTWVACMGIVALTSNMLEADIHASIMLHDTNGDGQISGNENTEEAELAMQRRANDVGRKFGPILAMPIFAIWILMIHLAGIVVVAIAKNLHQFWNRLT